MARLAIKGDKTRGDQVLAILKMLGGKVSNGRTGTIEEHGYFINDNGLIDYAPYINSNNSNFKVYTLDEFNKENPYKPGDKVKVEAYPNEIVTIDGVLWHCALCKLLYSVMIPTNLTRFYNADELLPITKEENLNIAKILKDAPKGTKLYSPICGECELNCVDNSVTLSIVVSVDGCGNFYFTNEGKHRDISNAECLLFPSKENRDWSTFKVEPQFPTDIADCRRILKDGTNKMTHLYELAEKIDNLRQLLIARDAWWKVDNNWKPDWSEKSDTWKYVIIRREDKVLATEEVVIARTLTFRTEEIRDKFLKTFKKLIEQCKELI